MLNGPGQIRGHARVVARMLPADGVNVQQHDTLAELGRGDAVEPAVVDALAIQAPLDVDGKIAARHGTLKCRRVAKVGGLIAECEGNDFRWDCYVGVMLMMGIEWRGCKWKWCQL